MKYRLETMSMRLVKSRPRLRCMKVGRKILQNCENGRYTQWAEDRETDFVDIFVMKMQQKQKQFSLCTRNEHL